MRVSLIVLISLAACGRFGFHDQPDGDAGNGAIDSADAAPLVPCVTDPDCGACQRCADNGFCANEPITQMFVGHRSTCFLGTAGSRWCAGEYVGLPNDANPLYPQRITGEDGWTAIYLGYATSFGIRTNVLYTFGANSTPTEVSTDVAWADINIQLNDYCFLRATGAVTCDSAAVTGTWSSVSTGYLYQCGVQPGGTAWCWGQDESNQLGLGVEADNTIHANPTQVGVATDWADVHAGASLTCGRKIDNTIWCWGGPAYTGTNRVDTLGVPTQISPDTDWTWLDVRWTHGCAGKANHRVTCWGSDSNFDIIPAIGDAAVPTDLGYTFDQFLMGGHHNCALMNGTWTCWGWNMYSQLGVGDTVDRTQPGAPLCGR